jgi:hypothetical protein
MKDAGDTWIRTGTSVGTEIPVWKPRVPLFLNLVVISFKGLL